jgi:hypothetical protein
VLLQTTQHLESGRAFLAPLGLEQLTGNGVDPCILSGGIWLALLALLALLTTAIGITVAIPAVLAHNRLSIVAPISFSLR